MTQVAEHWIDTSGGRLFACSWTPDTSAADAPILLLHDSIGCIALWRDFPALLAAKTGRRVIAYDRLGFGRSDRRSGRLPLDYVSDEARDVVPLVCDRLGVGRFVVCGHSIGGGMAVETAAQWPDRVSAMITIAAQARVDERITDGIRAAQRSYRDPANLAKLARYHGDKTQWVLSSWIDTWLSAEFANWTIEPSLAKIRCPVLAVHGETDEYGAPAHAAHIAEGRGEAAILAGIGHVPHREAPDQLVALITGLLASGE